MKPLFGKWLSDVWNIILPILRFFLYKITIYLSQIQNPNNRLNQIQEYNSKTLPLSLLHCNPGQHSGTHSVPHKEFWVPHWPLSEKTKTTFVIHFLVLKENFCELPCNGEDKTLLVNTSRSVNNTIDLSSRPSIFKNVTMVTTNTEKIQIWRTENDTIYFIFNILSVSINFLTHAEFPTTNFTTFSSLTATSASFVWEKMILKFIEKYSSVYFLRIQNF